MNLSLADALRAGFARLDSARSDDRPTIVDFSAVQGDLAAVRASIDALARLPNQLHADVLVSALIEETEPSEDVATATSELERRCECTIGEILEPLLACAPYEHQKSNDSSLGGVMAGIGLIVALAALVLTMAWRSPSPPSPGQASASTTSPTTTVPEPTTTVTTLDPALFTDPDRRLDINLTADGLVESRDPSSGRIIWQAGPYGDATAIRVDLNTVTVNRGRRGRMFINLIDGTLMPP